MPISSIKPGFRPIIQCANSSPFNSNLAVVRILQQQPFPAQPDGQKLDDVVVVRFAWHGTQARLPALVSAPRSPAIDAHQQCGVVVGALVRIQT